eukprot:m.205866 g.205866  ORF g.205866 m.205866 type:complete len:126 (-) comp15018_c0_seq22:3088-3465(-)
MLQRVLATTSRRACASHLSHQVRRASMLGVYNTLKAEVPDHILLVQMGNFYELVGPDAQEASRALPLKRAESGLAGFPIHRLDVWLPQFVAAFDSVALADQVMVCINHCILLLFSVILLFACRLS